jgi:Domain of unknown function (DUF5753)
VAEDPRTTLQVLPFSSGSHPSPSMSLTLLTMPDGGEAAYVEGGYFGQLLEEKGEVREKKLAYDRILGKALPPDMSRDMVRSVMEDYYGASGLPPRHARRRVAQEQLQQSAGWRLRRGRRRPR